MSVLTAKILPELSASERLILIDTLIVAAGVFIFGLEIGLYAVVAVFVTGKVSDAILDGLKFAKIAYIISDHPEEISEHILRAGASLALPEENAFQRQFCAQIFPIH